MAFQLHQRNDKPRIRGSCVAQLHLQHIKTYEHFYHLHTEYLNTQKTDKQCLLCDGELFVEDVAQTLKQQGYAIYPWATGRLSLNEVKRCLDVYQPDLVMAVNFRKGLGEISKLTDAPVVCWEIDPAVDTPPRAPEGPSGDGGGHGFNRQGTPGD